LVKLPSNSWSSMKGSWNFVCHAGITDDTSSAPYWYRSGFFVQGRSTNVCSNVNPSGAARSSRPGHAVGLNRTGHVPDRYRDGRFGCILCDKVPFLPGSEPRRGYLVMVLRRLTRPVSRCPRQPVARACIVLICTKQAWSGYASISQK
jgi:hypothetical protein